MLLIEFLICVVRAQVNITLVFIVKETFTLNFFFFFFIQSYYETKNKNKQKKKKLLSFLRSSKRLAGDESWRTRPLSNETLSFAMKSANRFPFLRVWETVILLWRSNCLCSEEGPHKHDISQYAIKKIDVSKRIRITT